VTTQLQLIHIIIIIISSSSSNSIRWQYRHIGLISFFFSPCKELDNEMDQIKVSKHYFHMM